MRQLLKFLCLAAPDRKLLVKTALLLWVVRLGLWLLPFERLRRLLFRKIQTGPRLRGVDQATVERIAQSVKVMSRYVPAATCLTRALVTLVLFERYGHPACLRIGVAKNREGKLEAHAWVESQGKIINGGHADLSRFTLLRPVELRAIEEI
jgi:hypothetical protein